MQIYGILSLTVLVLVLNKVDGSGCPERSFFGCVLRLKAQRVPFERSILAVVLKVNSEAKLKRTCSAYSNIMPCFRDKVDSCGNEKQRRLLKEVKFLNCFLNQLVFVERQNFISLKVVGKMIMYLCSPFSMDRQKKLFKYGKCIGEIFKHPITTGCELRDYHYSKQFRDCRKVCSARPTDFICMMKTWISEQNLCAVQDIEAKCGSEAAKFYIDMQITVFEPLFPVICDYDSSIPKISTTTSSKPVTILSLFHKLFPMASSIPNKLKNIADEKFPIFINGNQVLAKQGYSDGYSIDSNQVPTWTARITTVQWIGLYWSSEINIYLMKWISFG
uniref:DUF19 domain-containing protein n=1 Tax=Syphacia muris TaxID=451379 RepID=A0A0N5APS7_9BILA